MVFCLKKLSLLVDKISLKSLIVGLTFLAAVVGVILFLNKKPKETGAAWWDGRWHYRLPILVTNNSLFNGTSVPYRYNLDTSTLITAGKMLSSGNDIRVTDQSGTIVRHQVEQSTLNTTTTGVWFEASVPSKTSVYYYIYYGNPSATAAQFASDVLSDDGGTTVEMTDGYGYTTSTSYARVSDIRLNGSNLGVNGNYHYSSSGYPGGWWDDRVFTKTALASGPLFVEVKYEDTSYGSYSSFGTNIKMFKNGFAETRIYLNYNTSGSEYIYYYLHFDSGTRNSLWVNSSEVLVDQATDSGTLYQANLHDAWFGQRWTATGNYGGTIVIKNNSDWYYGATSAQASYYQTNYSYTEAYTNGSSRQIRYGVFAGNGSSADMNQKASLLGDYSTTGQTEEIGVAPAAYWKFDEGTGSTAYDSASNKNGTITGAVWKTEDLCVSGKCLYFDGVADNVSIGSAIYLAPNPGFTISHWIRTSQSNSQTYTVGNTGSANGYRFGISSGLVAFLIGQTAYSEKTCGTTTVNDNKWHLITGVYGSTSFTCYIDGRLEATVAYDVGEDYTGMSTSAPGIGAPPCCTDFQGFIDDVKIYPYQRTASQVRADYNATKGRAGNKKGSSANLGANKQSSDALSNGLVGYWRLDENTGTTTTDSSGNNSTGSLGAGTSAPTWATGKYGSSLSFDGSNDYVNVGSSAPLNSLTSMTLAAWINIGNTSPSYRSGIVSRRGASDGLNFDVSGALETGGGGQIEVMEAGSTAIQGSTKLSANTWYHAAAVMDGTDVKIYLNGALDGSGTLSWNWTSATPIYIGNINNIVNYFFNGKIDDVRIYNRALSPTEVRQLADWAPGPVGYWKMEEGSGTFINDSSGIGNTGTFSSSPAWTGGKYGKGLNFDGTDDYVSVADNNNSLDIAGPFTVTAWVKPSSLPAETVIVSKGGAGGSCHNYDFYIYNGKLALLSGNSCTWAKASATASITTDVWQHIAATFDGTNANYYINGVYKDNVSYSIGSTNNSAFEIGRQQAGAAGYFTGKMDEVKIYNYARTQKQIIEDMNADHPGVGSPVGSALVHLKFDEGYGATANNSGSAGSTLNGSLTGNTAPIWSNNGKYNKALSFNNGYVATSATTLGSAFTFSVWFNPASFVAWSGVLTNLKYNAAASGVSIVPQNGSVRICYGDGVNGYAYYDTTVSSLTTNQWYQAVYVYNGTTASLYINGLLYDSRNITISQSSQAIRVGIWASNYTGYLFNGLIDDVKVYNSALTADEIKADYNRGAALQMGSLSVNTGNTAPITAQSQEYCIPGDTAACAPPVVEWNFEEGSGTTVNETESGNNYSGSFGTGSSAPIWSTGKYGKALYFDSGDYVNLASLPAITAPYTVELWFYPQALTTNTLISLRGSNSFPIFSLWSNYKLLAYGNTSMYRYGTRVFSSSDLNKWWHVAFVVASSSSSTNWKVYLNGVNDTGTNSSSGTAYDPSTPASIGHRLNYADGINGKIDQVRIFNYIRTPAQITWDYNRGKPIAHWKMDDCQGSTAYDAMGNYNMTINIGTSAPQTAVGTCTSGSSSDAWYNGAAGKFNSSLSFDGVDDYAQYASPIFSTTDAAQPYSVTAWVKTTDSSGGILTQYTSSADRFGLRTNSDKLTYWKGGSDLATSSKNVTDNVWHFVGFTKNSSGTITLYIDGASDGTGTDSLDYESAPVRIGTFALGNTHFAGLIDDVRIYSYDLTTTQIREVYNQGAVVRFGPASGVPE